MWDSVAWWRMPQRPVINDNTSWQQQKRTGNDQGAVAYSHVQNTFYVCYTFPLCCEFFELHQISYTRGISSKTYSPDSFIMYVVDVDARCGVLPV